MKRSFRPKFSFLLIGSVLLHCGGDDGDGNSVDPLGEASVEFSSIRTSDGQRFERTEFDEINLPCDGNLSVYVTVDNWTLRPPGACAGANLCGYLTLRVDGDALVKSTAGARVGLNVLELSEPSGEHRLEIELQSDDGETYLFEEAPVSDSVTVRFGEAEGCVQGDAGGGGEGGVPSVAGAGGDRN